MFAYVREEGGNWLACVGKLSRVLVKKSTHAFYFIAFSILIIMPKSINTLKDETLRIPKW